MNKKRKARRKRKGWKNEPVRHGLASQGIETTSKGFNQKYPHGIPTQGNFRIVENSYGDYVVVGNGMSAAFEDKEDAEELLKELKGDEVTVELGEKIGSNSKFTFDDAKKVKDKPIIEFYNDGEKIASLVYGVQELGVYGDDKKWAVIDISGEKEDEFFDGAVEVNPEMGFLKWQKEVNKEELKRRNR